jgi:hypothetical protein
MQVSFAINVEGLMGLSFRTPRKPIPPGKGYRFVEGLNIYTK